MSEKTFVQKQLISKLATELENAQNEDTARKLLGKIAVVGAYLKRRSNLIFLENQTEIVPLEELKLCLQESAVNLRLCGVTCAFQLEIDEELSLNIAAKLYDFYEAVVESSLDTLSGLTAVFGRENEKFRLGLMLYCDQYLWPLADNFPEATISKEDDTWYLTMEVQEGGAAV